MMRTSIFVAALSALGMVAAQNFSIDPSSVSAADRASWCKSENNNCLTLCGGSAKTTTDDCNQDTLNYTCTCSNGSAPGLQYYTGTMPTFICQEAYSQCIVQYQDDQTGQKACNTTIRAYCGTLDPNTANTAAKSSSSASASATGSSSSGSATASSAAASSTSKAGAAPTNMAVVGNGAAVVVAGILAALL